MANEIRMNMRVNISSGDYVDSFILNQASYDQASLGGHKPIIIVGITEEVLSLGDIVTPGLCVFHNLDNTNYVEIGPEDGGVMVPMIRLAAGRAALLWLSPSVTLRGKANTAPVKLLMMALEA